MRIIRPRCSLSRSVLCVWVYKKASERQLARQYTSPELPGRCRGTLAFARTKLARLPAVQWEFLWLPWWERFWPPCALMRRHPRFRSRVQVCADCTTHRRSCRFCKFPHHFFAVLVQTFDTVHPKILHKSRPTRSVSV